MSALAPLPVAVPLLAAAALAAATPVLGRRASDAVATVAALAVAAITAILLADAAGEPFVYWFGGWEPRHGVALGIDLFIDPLGAGMALLAALIVIAVCIFSWRYFDHLGPLFYTLLLVFLAGMVGFSLTGDLFNLFVFLELMSVAAYALTAYHNDQAGPLQGAVNFAVTNSIGSFLIASGIGLLYARTGALNMAQIGEALARREPDALVVTAFVLLTSGFFVKAAIVPFHFWLADAYSVAPSPVCALFSAAMAELGLYALARVYWTVFSGAFAGDEEAIRAVLVTVGAATALIAAVMSFSESHLKRLLAFATISHLGLFLVGLALLTPKGLAGASTYVVGDGFVKASLFLGVGILAYRWGTVDQLELRGAGRVTRVPGALFAVGGLALASLPPFGTFTGKSLVDEAGSDAGYGWIAVVLVLATALTSGAVLRAAGRLLGPGSPEPGARRAAPIMGEEKEEREELPAARRRAFAVMEAPAVALMVAALVWGVLPGLRAHVESAAARFEDRPAYADLVLRGEGARAEASIPKGEAKAKDFAVAALSVAGGLVLALTSLAGRPRPRGALRRLASASSSGMAALKALHSGHVGDYAAWLTLGVAALGGVFALTIT